MKHIQEQVAEKLGVTQQTVSNILTKISTDGKICMPVNLQFYVGDDTRNCLENVNLSR